MSSITIATPLEPELAARIAAELPTDEVNYRPELLPPPRYPGDHRGEPDFRRAKEQEHRWRGMLAGAEVTFGIPGDDPRELHRLLRDTPDLRYVQATAAGAGQQVAAAGLTADDLQRVAIASSSGVHAGPLAEFAILGLLAITRDLPRLQQNRAARRWGHYPTPDLAGRTALILGVGAIGRRIAVLASALGMRVIGMNTTGEAPEDTPLDDMITPDRLSATAPVADVLIVTLPETPQTIGLVNADILRSLPRRAVVINVGRGTVLDEAALIDLLSTQQLAGAALDVTAEEPLPPDSALWELPNVILSPHTAALSPRENERIVELFLDNIHRLRSGRPIRNRITTARRY